MQSQVEILQNEPNWTSAASPPPLRHCALHKDELDSYCAAQYMPAIQ